MSDAPSEILDLAKASVVELAEFAERHGIALDLLERCQKHIETAAPFRGRFQLLALALDSSPSAASMLVLRLVRDDSASVELPASFPTEHLQALLELLDEA